MRSDTDYASLLKHVYTVGAHRRADTLGSDYSAFAPKVRGIVFFDFTLGKKIQRAEAVVKDIYVGFFYHGPGHIQSLTLTAADVLTASHQNIIEPLGMRINEIRHLRKP